MVHFVKLVAFAVHSIKVPARNGLASLPCSQRGMVATVGIDSGAIGGVGTDGILLLIF
jgi:hypothetical protein